MFRIVSSFCYPGVTRNSRSYRLTKNQRAADADRSPHSSGSRSAATGPRPYRLLRREVAGSAFGCSSSGAKNFAVMYRFAGRLRRLTLGSHPPLGLADARELARDALRKAALGKDPAAEKLGLRTADSFEELAVRYMERHAKVKKRSWRDVSSTSTSCRSGGMYGRGTSPAATSSPSWTESPITPQFWRTGSAHRFRRCSTGPSRATWSTTTPATRCRTRTGTSQGPRSDGGRNQEAMEGPRRRAPDYGRDVSAAPHNGAARRRGSFDGVARG